MKTRRKNVVTGNKCVNKVRNYCDEHNLIFQAEPREDFGVDCYIEIEIEGVPTNFIVGLQCKSGQSYKTNETHDSFDIYLSADDKAYWLGANFPILFVYFDDQNESLYYQHIQSIFQDISDYNSLKKLHFTNEHKTDHDELSEFLKFLSIKTPNHLDRMNIACTKEIQWFINHKRANKELQSIPKLSNLVCIEKKMDCGLSYPWLSMILGYSHDDNWVCILESQQLGQKCSNVNGLLLNLNSWVVKKQEIFTEAEYDFYVDNQTSIPENIIHSRLNEFQKNMKELDIQPVNLIYERKNYFHDAQDDDISLLMNTIKYSLKIRKHRGFEELNLFTNNFVPEKKANLLFRPTRPALCHADFESFEEVKYIDKIQKIYESLSGNLISVALVTNPENGCWGSNDIHFAHFYKNEIINLCVQSLM